MNLSSQLPALIIMVPFIAGLIVPFFPGGRRPFFLVMGAVSITFLLVLRLLADVQQAVANFGHDAAIQYFMGNWAVPWGIEYRIDSLSAFMLVIVTLITLGTTCYTFRGLKSDMPVKWQPFFYSIWMLFTTGNLGIIMTGDAFNAYVLLEIASISGYTLVAMGNKKNPKALKASMNYLIIGSIGASFILLGIGYLYSVTGTLNMMDLNMRLAELHANRAVSTGTVFILLGLGVKMALFPLHTWLPDAHECAPQAVSALLPGTIIKVAIYLAVRFLYSVQGIQLSFEKLPTSALLLTLACLAILGGSYYAIWQNNLKRILAYSTIAQVGYMILGIALVNEAALTGALVHFFNHAVIKGGLFMVVGIMIVQTGGADLENLRGIGRSMPWTSAAFLIGGLSLIGVPMTTGFISKWYLVRGILESGYADLAFIVLIGSFFSFAYVWRVVEVLYFHEPKSDVKVLPKAHWSMVASAWMFIGASVYFGIQAAWPLKLAGDAAKSLLGVNG